MVDFVLPDDSDGAASSSDPRVEARYASHGQVRMNRMFSVPQMSRTTNPTAETVNGDHLAAWAESEENAAAGGTGSPPSGDVASHVQLHLRPLTTESQVKDTMEEQIEGMDASTSLESEPSEEKDGEFQAVLEGSGSKIWPQPLGQEPTDTSLIPTDEPSSLHEAPEKEGKGEEGAPASHPAAEKEPVVLQFPEGPEPVFPQVVPEEEKNATQLPEEMESPLPQMLPEPVLPQSVPEEEKNATQLPEEMDSPLPQPLPEPVLPQSVPEEEKNATQLPEEMDSPLPQPLPENEQKIPQLPPEMGLSVPQAPPDEDQKVPHCPQETEPSVPQPLLKKEPPVPRPRLFKEPQTSAEVEPPVPRPRVFKEPLAPQVPPTWESIAARPPATKESPFLQSQPEEPVIVKEHIALRGRPLYYFERPTIQQEKETVIRSETKAWPEKEDTSSFALAYPKPKPATVFPGEKDSFLNNPMEDLTSHLRQVGNASKSAMASSISTFVGSPLGQVFAHTIDRALDKSEEWLDYYLPESETNVEASAAVQGEHSDATEDHSKEGCFMRINTLSTKLRNRAFRLALHQLKTTRQAAKENLPVLDQMLDVLEHTRGQNLLTIPSIPESLQNLWAQWSQTQQLQGSTKTSGVSSKEPLSIVPEQLELKALDLSRTLAQQLYSTYHNLLPHVPDLPAHLQEKVIRVCESMEKLQAHFAASPSLQDLPSSLIIQSRHQVCRAQENLDEILDFMAQNPATKWLSQPTSSTKGKQPVSAARERQPKGRSPEQRVRENSPASRPSPSPPRHL